jgi:large subunit ribosomal protein L22
MSPRKVRLVVNMVRGMKVTDALDTLRFVNKAAAEPVTKILQSAAANAEHNFKLDRNALVISKITADGGPIAYRWQPHAFGRATQLRKRTTHLTVVLSDMKKGAGNRQPNVDSRESKVAQKPSKAMKSKPAKSTKESKKAADA